MKKILPLVFVLTLELGTVGIASAITNGVPDAGAHPYVGLLVFDDTLGHPAWRCSGSLISPTVVLTAGHCTDGAAAARVWFEESVEGNPEYPFSGVTSYDGVPYTHPDFCIGCGKGQGLPGFNNRDVGVVVLSEPVPASVLSTYAELPDAGLVDTLKNMTDLDLVGYGVQDQIHGGGQPSWTGLKVRLYAPSQFISGNDDLIRITLNPGQGKGGTCFGDSGGPNLLGDTDTVLAADSFMANRNCAGIGYSSRIDIPEVLEWILSFLP